VVNQINLEVSVSRVNMRTSVQYSYDGFTRQKTQLGHTVYIATHEPRNLPVKTSLRVAYPQTLSIRVYGWSTADFLVNFHNRNVMMDAQVFGRDLLVNAPTDTLTPQPTPPEVGPVSPETLCRKLKPLPNFLNLTPPKWTNHWLQWAFCLHRIHWREVGMGVRGGQWV
jgi:hypothetical protein